MKGLMYTALFALLAMGCDQSKNPIPGAYQQQVLIVNEGNYGWGNAELSAYNRSSNSIQNEVFQQVNGMSAGDVAQSVYLYDSLLYVVMNNSGCVHQLSRSSLKYQTTYTGFNAPRYCLRYGHMLYVSELYESSLKLLNLQNNEISRIECAGNTAQLFMHSARLFVVCGPRPFSSDSAHELLVIDPGLEQIEKRIPLAVNPVAAASDGNSLWILCNGDSSAGQSAALHEIDLPNRTIAHSYPLAAGSKPYHNLCIDSEQGYAYFLREDLYRINLQHPEDGAVKMIAADGRNFYSLYFDSEHRELYLSDAGDYVSRSTIYRYNDQLLELDRFSAGRISGFMQWNP